MTTDPYVRAETGSAPHLRIERGTPDADELAAVLLVLLTATRTREPTGGTPTPHPRSPWGPPRGWRPPGAWATTP
ncbi:acyl-CoA carboxylase epsilon subunit [Streptomyces sp. NPDC057682]|uniref:acyl-CoA carboxylase epsilon subunit n=1 Tax=unclassified Streptomyces TaxID=2593676 RepID=UPI00364B904E